ASPAPRGSGPGSGRSPPRRAGSASGSWFESSREPGGRRIVTQAIWEVHCSRTSTSTSTITFTFTGTGTGTGTGGTERRTLSPRGRFAKIDASCQKPGNSMTAFLHRRYRLLRLLGEGGMGRVHLAEDLLLDRARVALKVYPSGTAPDLLRREFLTLKALRHPGIARAFHFGTSEADGSPFFTMEPIAGAPLDPDLPVPRGHHPPPPT